MRSLFKKLGLSLTLLILLGGIVVAQEEAASAVANIRIVGWTIDDSVGGNGDGGLHPGESAFLRIHLSNGGSATARNVAATLSEVTDHPDVTIIDKFALWPDLQATGTTANSAAPHFSIQVASTRPCSWQVPLKLEIVADNGYLVTREFVVTMRDRQVVDLLLDRPRPAIYGRDALDNLGKAIAAGDFNGDGYDDVILGVPAGDTMAGEGWVVYGGPSPRPDVDLAAALNPARTWIHNDDLSDQLGEAVAAGDLDGDGNDDLIFGSPFGAGPLNTDPDLGEVHVIYGLAAPPTSIFLPLDGFVDVGTIYGADNSDRIGTALATGDINGDGLEDVIIGIENGNGPGNARSASGEVVVIFGDTARMSSLDLAAPTPNVLTVYGAQSGDRLGISVAAGDLDGDGFDDLLLSDQSDGPNDSRPGAGGMVIVYGSDVLPSTIDLASAPPDVGYVYGVDPGDGFGAVATGDLNGDGYDEAIGGSIGGAGADNTFPVTGEVAIVSGGPSRITQVDLASPFSSASSIYGPINSDLFGRTVAAGDVDGDGYDDLLIGGIGMDGPNGGRSNAGGALLIFGNSRGIPSLDASLPSDTTIMFHGEEISDRLGRGLALGDIDGDGFDDPIMGAFLADGPQGVLRDAAGTVVIRPGKPRSSYRHDPDTFSWIDTSGEPALGLACDDCGVTIPIGFDFDFYGTTHGDVTISSNGYLTFGGVGNLPGGFCPPATNLPDELIAVFWDDLDLSAGGSVHSLLEGTAPNRRLTIAWLGVPYFGIGGDASFEVTLFETSDQILFQYQDVIFNSLPDNGATAIIGVEGRGGHNGTPMSCPGTGLGVADSSAARWRRFASPTLFYGEDVETLGQDWTPTGLWGATNFFGCNPESSSGDISFYYGQNSCDYETGSTNSGSLISPIISSLPQDARLAFRHRRLTESPDLIYDQSIVRLQVNGGGFSDLVQVSENSNSWLRSDDFLSADPEAGQFAPLDLSAHAGQDIDLSFFFDTTDAAGNAFLGWMVDDVEIHACPVFGGGAAAKAVATAQPNTICETDDGQVDAIGSYCASCTAGLTYQWSRDSAPIGGATNIVYDIAAGGTLGDSGYSVGIDCPTNAACMTESSATTVTVVAQVDAVANTLAASRTTGTLTLQWSDVAAADDYVVFSSTAATGAFTDEAGASSSGASGLMVPLPADTLVFYLVAGRNDTCGVGLKNNFASP